MTDSIDPKNKLFCAINETDQRTATNLAARISDHVGGIKLGIDFFCANGPKGVKEIAKASEKPLYLDMKLFEIPSTLSKAVGALLDLQPDYLTLHAGSGRASLAAAKDLVHQHDSAIRPPQLIASTVLTSFDDDSFHETGARGTLSERVERMAELAQTSGLSGVECSPHEITGLRQKLGNTFTLVVSGLRPQWAGGAYDQKRIQTPYDAYVAGADILVIGRPVTADQNPLSALQRLEEELIAAQEELYRRAAEEQHHEHPADA